MLTPIQITNGIWWTEIGPILIHGGYTRDLINSRFGVSYSNFSFLTPTFWKVSIDKYGKTPNFFRRSGGQHFSPIFKILVRTLGYTDDTDLNLQSSSVSTYTPCLAQSYFFVFNKIKEYIFFVFWFPVGFFLNIRGMFEMNCLFLSGDFKFQVSLKVLISCPRSTPRG